MTDLKQSPSAKLKSFRAKSSPSTGPTCHATKMLENSQQSDLLPMELPLTSSQEASPARTQVLQTLEAKALTARGLGCSERPSASFANWDQAWSCWKTSQTSLTEGLETFSEPWPRRGMMRNGTVLLLPTLVPGIAGTEFGYLPTPNASGDGKGSPKNRFYGSDTYRGNLREYLRDGVDDPPCPTPELVEQIMGFPVGWTAVETQ